MLKSMIEKQRQLDLYIAKEKGLGDPYDKKYYEKTKLALLVEIGELANATRCFKYWSNKTSEARERLLDEIADCLHFIFRLMIFNNTKLYIKSFGQWEEESAKSKPSFDFICKANIEVFFNLAIGFAVGEQWDIALSYLLSVAVKLGLQMRELEEAYLKKHEENYRRQQEGY